MNPHLLKLMFPRASAAVIAANAKDYGTGYPTETPISNAKPAQSTRGKSPLDRTDAGKAQGAKLPHVCFTLRRVNLLDVDAKYGSVKDLLDGLQYAGLVDGDREDQITLEVRQQKVAHYVEEETEIELTLP